MIKLGTFGILRHQQFYLLGKRVADDKTFASLWCHPGGGVEYGESIDKALIREFREEVLLEVRIAPSGYTAIHEYIKDDRHVVLVFKEVEMTLNQKAPPAPGDGFSEVDWFTYEQIVTMDVDGLTTPLTWPAAAAFEHDRITC